MNQEFLIKKIKEKAKKVQRYRRDQRFRDAMGFLVAKGFLRANWDVRLLPNIRLKINEVIWAGRNVEPRILEVLPAAILRLEKHFDLDPVQHPKLVQIVGQLRNGEEHGDDFENMPYAKMKTWADSPLKDKRVKSISQKKVMKSFRLRPQTIQKIKDLALLKGSSEADVVEELVRGKC